MMMMMVALTARLPCTILVSFPELFLLSNNVILDQFYFIFNQFWKDSMGNEIWIGTLDTPFLPMGTGREKCFATVVLIRKGVMRTQMWYSRKWSNWPPSPSSKRLLSRKRPLYDVQFVLDSLFNRRPRLIDAPPPPVTVLKNTRN